MPFKDTFVTIFIEHSLNSQYQMWNVRDGKDIQGVWKTWENSKQLTKTPKNATHVEKEEEECIPTVGTGGI